MNVGELDTTTMNEDLRVALLAAFTGEAVEGEWGDHELERGIRKIVQVPDGAPLPALEDSDMEDTTTTPEEFEAAQEAMPPATFVVQLIAHHF